MSTRGKNAELPSPNTSAGASAGLPNVDIRKLSKKEKLICEFLMSCILSYFDFKLTDKEKVLQEEVVDDHRHVRGGTLSSLATSLRLDHTRTAMCW